MWTFAEITATLVAVGISASMPVFRRVYQKGVRLSRRNPGKSSWSEALTTPPMQQNTIGGGAMPRAETAQGGKRRGTDTSLFSLSIGTTVRTEDMVTGSKPEGIVCVEETV